MEKRSRRSLLRAVGTAVVASGGLAGAAAAGGDGGQEKVPICHCPPGRQGENCKTLYLPKNAAEAHLRNHPDDSPGPCKKKGRKKKRKKKKGRKKKKKKRKKKH